MRGVRAGSLVLVLACFPGSVSAEDGAWRPSLGRPEAIQAAPSVTLGKPEAISSGVEAVSYQNGNAPLPPPIIRGQIPDAGPAPYPPAPGLSVALPGNRSELYNCGMANQDPSPGNSWWDGCRNKLSDLCGKYDGFKSDHAFDEFVSPISNPFLFEDPRSLTEVRPIFILQGTPSKPPFGNSGTIEYFGIAASLAITDRFSIVMNKFGGVWGDTLDGTHDGFAEIWIGPKYTFLRNEGTGTLGAFGLIFQIPAGSSNVQQDTGSLTLTPYVSFAQKFCKSDYGSFHFMSTLGYNASVDNERSSNVYSSLHLDYDILNLHKFYPLIELNYFHYTSNGSVRPLTFEGADLVNYGSTEVTGHNYATFAFGGRYKYNEHLSFGLAGEVPITGRKDLMEYRFTFDVIFRY